MEKNLPMKPLLIENGSHLHYMIKAHFHHRIQEIQSAYSRLLTAGQGTAIEE